MAYVKDTLSWAVDEADFRIYAGIVAGDATRDNRLAKWFAEAVYEADYYMENPFVDSDGVDVTQPPHVRDGVYDYVIASDDYTNTGSSSGAKTAVKTGQLQETYAKSAGGSKSAPRKEISIRAAAPNWFREKIDLLKAGTL